MRRTRLAIATMVISLLAGVWLFLAPFLIEYQEVGQEWIDATRNSLATGGALIAIAAAGLLTYAALALRDATRAATLRGRPEDSGDTERSAPGAR